MKKIVGIDIGGSSVKLAYFAGSTLKKAAMAPLPDNMVADGRILSMDAMADFLRQAARDNGIPLTNAAVVLPSTEVFTRELTMPAMTEQQLRYNLPYEFRDFLTDEKSKYYFDYSMRDILRDQDGYPTEMTLLASGQERALPQYDNDQALMTELDKLMAATLQYEVDCTEGTTQEGYLVLRPVTLTYQTASYAQSRQIIDALSASANVNFLSNVDVQYDADKAQYKTVLHLIFFELMP